MISARLVVACFAILFLAPADPASGQDFKPPAGKLPDGETLKSIQAKTTGLSRAIGLLRKQGVRDPALADVDVYYQAAVNILEHQEFFHKDSAAWTRDVLDRGLLRASLLSGGEMPWIQARGISVPRGFRSRIDGSLQPYAATLPQVYGKDQLKKWPIEVWLHGRDKTLTEVKFLRAHHGEKEVDLDHIRIDIYGRGNNAYRWAGETDVFEAIDHFVANERLLGRAALVDPDRVLLRGFSMGGAGAWHLGLHWPDRWVAVNPGAGFSTTRGYLKGLPEKLPYYQEAALRIYDAVDYADNAFNVSLFAYSGAKDAQKLAADLIEQRLKMADIRMTHVVAPDLAHSYPAPWQAKVKDLMKDVVAAGRPDYPNQVRFVTYTLKYPSCFWVEILGLEKHYERSEINAERIEDGFRVATKNVRNLRLAMPPGVSASQDITIDGQELTVRPVLHPNHTFHIYLDSRDGKWRDVLPQRLLTIRAQKPQKIGGLQGPIDDAFTEAFLCVRGSEKPWHQAVDARAAASLERFQKEWSKYFRGQLPIKDDIEVTSEDIAGRHLILFGDPASNSLIGQVVDGLPIGWTQKSVTVGDKTYPSASHLPVLIYPNPLNAERYVVLNTGHTFQARDFEGTNALLYPRLGDWAILRAAEGASEVVEAGLFDEFWKLK